MKSNLWIRSSSDLVALLPLSSTLPFILSISSPPSLPSVWPIWPSSTREEHAGQTNKANAYSKACSFFPGTVRWIAGLFNLSLCLPLNRPIRRAGWSLSVTDQLVGNHKLPVEAVINEFGDKILCAYFCGWALTTPLSLFLHLSLPLSSSLFFSWPSYPCWPTVQSFPQKRHYFLCDLLFLIFSISASHCFLSPLPSSKISTLFPLRIIYALMSPPLCLQADNNSKDLKKKNGWRNTPLFWSSFGGFPLFFFNSILSLKLILQSFKIKNPY